MKDLNFMMMRIKKFQSKSSCLVFGVLALFCGKTAKTQGDLMIFPKRIVFEGSIRSHEINLANSGKDTARYVISVVQIRMKEDGGFENITKPDSGQNFADKYFRIFPRKVVLAPNEAQTVKIQLTNTGDMQPGEYRSHLYIRAEEEKIPLGDENIPKETKNIAVVLKAVFGISIPVIILSGTNTARVTFSDVAFIPDKDNPPSLKFTCNRNGNMSVYGDIAVDYISTDGKTTRVAVANGLAVYNPTAKRNFTLPLNYMAGVDYHKGRLKVSYKYDAASNSDKIASETVNLH